MFLIASGHAESVFLDPKFEKQNIVVRITRMACVSNVIISKTYKEYIYIYCISVYITCMSILEHGTRGGLKGVGD